jgi:uncharacterized membrane protein
MAERDNSQHWEQVRESASEVLNVRAEVTRAQRWPGALTEAVGHVLAYPMFFVGLLMLHLLWVFLNLGIVSGLEPWDPYPFTFLATFASVEAPFISLLVLTYQQRSSRISELREEINLQVSLHLERQMSVTLRLLGEMEARLGIDSEEDPRLLERLRQPLNPKELLYSLRRELRRAEGDEQATAP